MYCQKCKYTSFDHYKKCPSCGTEWAETLKELNLTWLEPTESAWFEEDEDNAGVYSQSSTPSTQTNEEEFLLEFDQEAAGSGDEKIESGQGSARDQESPRQYEPDEDADFALQAYSSTEDTKTEDSISSSEAPPSTATGEVSRQTTQDRQEDKEEGLFVPGLEEMFSSEEDEQFSAQEATSEENEDEETLDLLSEFESDSYGEEYNADKEIESTPEADLDELIQPEEDFAFLSSSETAEDRPEAEDKNERALQEESDFDVDFIPELETLELDNDQGQQRELADSSQQETDQGNDLFELSLDEDEELTSLEDIEIELDEDETEENFKSDDKN
jgi:hypothetical protein